MHRLLFFALSILLNSNESYVLHTATSCFSKHFLANEVFNRSTLEENVPLRYNGKDCGEDDFLASDANNLNLLAVADGVGGWNEFNVNPKFFVEELMSSIENAFQETANLTGLQHDNQTEDSILYKSVIDAMDTLHTKNQESDVFLHGSCTLAAFSINLQTLHAKTYLVGDAGFMVIRNGYIIERSIDQLKGFNFPYQLGLDSFSDNATSGINSNINLKSDDVIIIGSDGLFDNLFNEEIVSIVNGHMEKFNKNEYAQTAEKIAKVLTGTAKLNGEKNSDIKTPFAFDFERAFDTLYFGGKNDDTTVFVAIISNE